MSAHQPHAPENGGTHAGPSARSVPPARLAWPRRLGVRLPFTVTVVTLIAVTAVAMVTIRQQRAQAVAARLRDAALFSETLRSSTHKQMLLDRKEEVYGVMERIGRQPGVRRVRIFDHRGVTTFSTDREEIARKVRKDAASCAPCHVGEAIGDWSQMASRVREGVAPDGETVLDLIVPLENQAGCSRPDCHAHAPDQRVLGVAEIEMSLADDEAFLAASARNTGLLAALVVLVVGLLVYGVTHVFVLRPVHDLLGGTQRVAGGDLRTPIPTRSKDELGELATSFNDMRQALVRMHEERQALLTGLERQVEERTEELKKVQAGIVQAEKLASLGKLSASIAHEINNPLAGILTFSKLIGETLEKGPPDDVQRTACIKQIKLVRRETERCSTIVRHLLDFARERPLALGEVDVNAPLEEALSLAGHKIEQQGIRLRKELGNDLVVHADFGQLRQAFLNVILNACDAMGEGGEMVLSTRRRRETGNVEVNVSDSGTGIPPEHIHKIFDPFFTTKDRGTGLGLSVVYGIAEKHGGRMEVQSQVGRGTTMTILLPSAVKNGGPEPA